MVILFRVGNNGLDAILALKSARLWLGILPSTAAAATTTTRGAVLALFSARYMMAFFPASGMIALSPIAGFAGTAFSSATVSFPSTTRTAFSSATTTARS
jgi:hypothetical protein